MTSPCPPTMAVEPLPCTPGGPPDGSPGPLAGCCAPSLTSATWCDGDDVITVVLQSTCAECGTPAGVPTIIGSYGPAGVFTPGPPPAGAEPCAGLPADISPPEPPCATVTTTPLCDIGAAGCIRFLRHLVHDCTGQVTATADTTVTGLPYTPVNPGDCDTCPCEPEPKVMPLCDTLPDGTVVRFLREITYDCDTGQILTQVDTELDRSTPYTPQGEVGNCPCGDQQEPCEPEPVCARFSGIAGPDTWTMPEDTESLTLNIICGQGITITDCQGEVTIVDEGCGSLSWAAPQGGGCEPRTLCIPFTVQIPDGAAVYASWVELGCGDQSPGQSPGESP